jgi:regulator of nucleoside diphosphate kinase
MEPIISETDYKALRKILVKQKSTYGKFLKGLLQKFKRVKEKEMSDKTVRLNSIVEVWNSLLKKIMKIKIVLPSLANIKEKKISIFSPISLALIGYKENDVVEMDIPGVRKQLKIIRVINS